MQCHPLPVQGTHIWVELLDKVRRSITHIDEIIAVYGDARGSHVLCRWRGDVGNLYVHMATVKGGGLAGLAKTHHLI